MAQTICILKVKRLIVFMKNHLPFRILMNENSFTQKWILMVVEEAPVVPLFYDMAVRFVNKKVSGLGINPQNFLVLKRVKKSF